jgi:hypothetical protein
MKKERSKKKTRREAAECVDKRGRGLRVRPRGRHDCGPGVISV